MPRSPVKNLLIVIVLLALMASATALMTHTDNATASTGTGTLPRLEEPPGLRTDVEIIMLFSHRPQRIRIESQGIDLRPSTNEIRITLQLPVNRQLELPLDITWPGQADEGSSYFTRLTIRQDGKEDNMVHYTGQHAEFADVFIVNTME
jgi:hypothetical protein